MEKYATIYGFADTLRSLQRFIRLVRAQDKVFLKFWSDKAKKKATDAEGETAAVDEDDAN
ncbi:MAG: hypothetical protein ACREBE_13915 [bacterium]